MATSATIAKKIQAVQAILTKHRTAVKERIARDTQTAKQRMRANEEKTISSIRSTIATS